MTNAASPQSASVNQTHVNNVGNGDQDEVNTENLDGVTLIEDTPSEQEPSAIINANLNAMNTSEPSQEQKPEAGLPLQAVSLETRNLSLPPRIERPSADLNLVHPTRRQVLKGNQDLKSLEEQMTQAGYTIDQVEDSFFGYSIHSIMQNRYKLDQPTPCATLLSMELDSPLPNGPQRQLEIVDRILTLRNLRRKLLGRSFESFRFFDPSTPSASHGSLVQVEVDQSLRSFLYDAWSRRDERSAWKRLELQLVPLVKANRAFFPELWKCNFLGG